MVPLTLILEYDKNLREAQELHEAFIEGIHQISIYFYQISGKDGTVFQRLYEIKSLKDIDNYDFSEIKQFLDILIDWEIMSEKSPNSDWKSILLIIHSSTKSCE